MSSQERDRRAIPAMAGGFRTRFDFIETVGSVDGYQAERPYQSWGTEYDTSQLGEPRISRVGTPLRANGTDLKRSAAPGW